MVGQLGAWLCGAAAHSKVSGGMRGGMPGSTARVWRAGKGWSRTYDGGRMHPRAGLRTCQLVLVVGVEG